MLTLYRLHHCLTGHIFLTITDNWKQKHCVFFCWIQFKLSTSTSSMTIFMTVSNNSCEIMLRKKINNYVFTMYCEIYSLQLKWKENMHDMCNYVCQYHHHWSVSALCVICVINDHFSFTEVSSALMDDNDNVFYPKIKRNIKELVTWYIFLEIFQFVTSPVLQVKCTVPYDIQNKLGYIAYCVK